MLEEEEEQTHHSVFCTSEKKKQASPAGFCFAIMMLAKNGAARSWERAWMGPGRQAGPAQPSPGPSEHGDAALALLGGG